VFFFFLFFVFIKIHHPTGELRMSLFQLILRAKISNKYVQSYVNMYTLQIDDRRVVVGY